MSTGNQSARPATAATARSPQLMRGLNASTLLNLFWDAPYDSGLTATEIVESTGLTRPTVLAICSDLRDTGWVIEDRAPSATPGRGRQARRFTFNRGRHLVAAADVGIRSVTTVVADLSGTVLGRVRHSFDGDEEWQVDRTDHLLQTLDEAVSAASVERSSLVAGCIGVAAPVTSNGEPFPCSPFWDLVRLDPARLSAHASSFAPGWRVEVHNDANLAALAELHAAGPEMPSPSITLLAGERLGAGLLIDGQVIRGANGGAGEMAYLERIHGVDNSIGIVGTVRYLVQDALAAGRHTSLAGDELVSLAALLHAADHGDAVATEIREKLLDKLALTVLTLSGFVDPALVIFAGGAAEAVTALIPGLRARLAELSPYPPALEASSLGRDVVLQGAVRNAINTVRRSTTVDL